MSIHLSVVIPLNNEENLIDELINRVTASILEITGEYEIILVDDGSTDRTWEFILKHSLLNSRLKGIKFSRNFGQHYAITAGLSRSNGAWVVVMDGDLQDRPEVIGNLYQKALEGYDIVFVSRINRPESKIYKFFQRIFYIVLNLLSGLKLDYKKANYSIISKQVVTSFLNLKDYSRFYGSSVKWLGFKSTQVEATHGMRNSGKSSYNFTSRFKLAMDIILSFSERPLKFAIYLGIINSLLSFILATIILIRFFKWGFSVVGWTSIIASILFYSGVILIILGIIGVYIGRVFQQVKNRPLFVVQDEINFTKQNLE